MCLSKISCLLPLELTVCTLLFFYRSLVWNGGWQAFCMLCPLGVGRSDFFQYFDSYACLHNTLFTSLVIKLWNLIPCSDLSTCYLHPSWVIGLQAVCAKYMSACTQMCPEIRSLKSHSKVVWATFFSLCERSPRPPMKAQRLSWRSLTHYLGNMLICLRPPEFLNWSNLSS